MDINAKTGTLLTLMREKAPLVQCVTNFVAMNIAANVLLAAGASPAMVHAEEEAGEFAGFAGALTINIGTLSTGWLKGMRAGVNGAVQNKRPWVLDPVAHYATAFRHDAVAELMTLRPAIVRGNASEIMALAGEQSRGQGVDSRDAVGLAEAPARHLAQRDGMVVAVTGEVDFVTDGKQAARIAGGSAWMPRVTALGCALTCLIGAFAAISPEEPFEATVAACAMFAVAGERAGREASGPGSFSWRFLDAIAALDGRMLSTEARLTIT